MPRIVRCSLVQATSIPHEKRSLAEIKQAMIDKHLSLIRQAAADGSQIVCLQELFYGPYFCAEQSTRWYDLAEAIPDGPTTKLMQDLAKELHVALVVPIYEMEGTGVYYNTAAVINNDGKYLGKYRKSHLPHLDPGFWEKFYFRPGNLGFHAHWDSMVLILSLILQRPSQG
jgi:N-carbamoylputrescine amidase